MGASAPTPTTPAPQAPAGAKPPALPPEVVDASLRCSIKDGAAWSVMQGAAVQYLPAYLVLVGRGLLGLAAFTGLPGLLGAIVQVFAADVTDRLGRRNLIIVPTAVAQGLLWIPICAAVFLPGDQGYWLMLVSYALHIGLAHFGQPAWQSLLGELVPPERRGRYFGLRGFVTGGVLVVSLFAAGWWLTWCKDNPGLALLGLSGWNFGFLTLFVLGLATRLLSAWYLSRVYDPEYHRAASDHFTLLDFLRRAPRAHFGRFVFYCMLMYVGIGAVAPFLAWYLLDQRAFSPAAYGTVMTAALLANYGSQPLWGRLLDRAGSKRVLAIGGLGLVLVPVLLLGCRELWHFALAQLYEGIVTAAFTMAMANYYYDVVTPPKRARCYAYLMLFVSLGSVAGNFIGAGLGEWIPLPLGVGQFRVTQPFALMLVVSTVLRLAANLLLLGSFAEFRLSRPAFESLERRE